MLRWVFFFGGGLYALGFFEVLLQYSDVHMHHMIASPYLLAVLY